MSTDELADLLERHGAELGALPGVVGFAIGASASGEPVIHLYVDSAEADTAAARSLLAPAPIEVIGIGPPEAEAG